MRMPFQAGNAIVFFSRQFLMQAKVRRIQV